MDSTVSELYSIKENLLKRYIIRMTYVDSDDLCHLDSNFTKIVSSWDKQKILCVLHKLDNHYYNGKSIVSDSTYDKLLELYESTYKVKYDKIGAPIVGTKVKLPIHMGSMDKVKPGSPELKRFFTEYRNNKCVMDKLDGTSLLIDLRDMTHIRAFTRGNGTEGQDISHKIEYLQGLNSISKWTGGGFIRGELIVPKSHWNKISHKGANARNYVSGVINRKVIDTEELSNIWFVAYEWTGGDSSSKKLSISQQLAELAKGNFTVVKNSVYNNLQESLLPEILLQYRSESIYEIDGIIIQDDVFYSRNTSKNPKYAKAFKMDSMSESANTKVKEIKWAPSKDGGLRPVVVFDEVYLAGVKITKATAYNAKYVKDNSIGPGAIIEIIRSGDVIPKIIKVVSPGHVEWPDSSYYWDTNNTHILLENKDSNRDVKIRQMEYFITTMGIPFFKKGLLTKAYDKGCNDIFSIISLTYEKLLDYKIDGVKCKTASKIIDAIQTRLSNTTVGIFAAATPYFNGMGSKRMILLDSSISNWLDLEEDVLRQKILNLDGFSEKSWNIIKDGRQRFNCLCQKCKDIGITFIDSQKTEITECIEGEYTGKTFMFTGFRDSELAGIIISKGGIIKDSLAKKNNITHLIIPEKSFKNMKTTKATDMGILLITKDEINIT